MNFLTGGLESAPGESSTPTGSARAAAEASGSAVERARLQGELLRRGYAKHYPGGMQLHPAAIKAFQELNSGPQYRERTVDNGHF